MTAKGGIFLCLAHFFSLGILSRLGSNRFSIGRSEGAIHSVAVGVGEYAGHRSPTGYHQLHTTAASSQTSATAG